MSLDLDIEIVKSVVYGRF